MMTTHIELLVATIFARNNVLRFKHLIPIRFFSAERPFRIPKSACHSERSEESDTEGFFCGLRPRILRCAQNDTRSWYALSRLGGIKPLLLAFSLGLYGMFDMASRIAA